MDEQSAKKQTFHLSKETNATYNEILKYLNKQDSLNSTKVNNSNAIKIVLEVFYDLFIKSTKTENLTQRLFQLKKIQPKDVQAQLDNLAFLKRQNDIQTYIILAVFQILSDQLPNWNPENLQSIYSGEDEKQNELMSKIILMIQEDTERGKTKKHSQ